jgi:hypothetical protein
VLDHARPGRADDGGAAFAACLRLFHRYPLAVRRHYAEHRYGSMVLLSRQAGRVEAGAARFYVLIMEWDDLFVLRHWDRRDGTRTEIGPDTPVPDDVWELLEGGVPVPRDGLLLGWLAGHQVQALVAAYGRLPEPWDDPSAVPGVLVMPRAGSQPAEWPPLAASPLGDGQLWDCLGRGQLVDLAPLVGRRAGRVFWVPGADGGPSGRGGQGGRQAGTRIVVTERVSGAEFWLPAGIYADHRKLREGGPSPTVSQLLARPGVTDLGGGRHGSRDLLGV